MSDDKSRYVDFVPGWARNETPEQREALADGPMMVPYQGDEPEAEAKAAELKRSDVSYVFVHMVEDRLGMGGEAWETLDPRDIIAEVLNAYRATGDDEESRSTWQ